MHNKEEQVSQLLTKASESLNFLRIVLDDLILYRDNYPPEVQQRIFTTQRNYKIHKAILTNIENLLLDRTSSLSDKLCNHLAINLRTRINKIINDAIDLDRLR